MKIVEDILALPYVDKLRKHTFIRSLIVSVLATITDYVISLVLFYVGHLYEVYATAIGSFCGAFVSFYLGRTWAFQSSDGKIHHQAIKYLFALGISIFLNSYGVFLLVKYASFPFIVDRVIVTIVVGLVVNYQLFKRFVFK
jgi:putative flippase GtrA